MKIDQNTFYLALANQTTEALIVLDASFNICLLNYGAEKIFRCRLDEKTGVPFTKLCEENQISCFFEDSNLHEKGISNLISTSIQPMQLNCSIERFIYGDDTFFLIKTIGLEQKQNQNEIFQLQTLIENMPCNVYWVDKKCTMINCNQNVLDMLQISREDFLGKTYEELAEIVNWPKGLAKKLKKDDISVMRSGKPIFGIEDPPIPNADGTFSNFLTSRVPLQNKKGEILGIAGISMDVTALKEAREKAEAANQAKRAFIANMSHDIRTPLTGVIGLSELLENELEDPQQKADAHLLYESGVELLKMLNGILEDVQAGEVSEDDLHNETFDLHQCIEDLIKLERPTTMVKHLKLNLTINSDVPRYIVSDRKKIHRVLLNLLGNSIKFTKEGHITIEVKNLGNKLDQIHLQFSVSDTGIGIPKALQKKVFDRFFRVTPSYKGIYKGHGLGLSIAKSYVNLLGGNIKLTSTEALGTTIYFDILCAKNSEGITEITPKKEPINTPFQANANEKTPHLLLIEDNIMALKVLEILITKSGCTFQSAQNGEDAFALVQSTPFDLIISDIGLPGISGNELALKVRQWEKGNSKKSQPIVGLTGHAKEMAYEECIASGMNDVFTKPADMRLIEQLVNQYVLTKELHIQTEEPEEKPKGIGLDLPNTEEELFKLNDFPILDIKYALDQINDMAALLQIIKESVSEHAQKDIQNMTQAYEQSDWKQVEEIAHKIKGGAVYIGTRRLFYACQYLERYYKSGHRQMLDKLYHQVLVINEETSKKVKEWLKIYS